MVTLPGLPGVQGGQAQDPALPPRMKPFPNRVANGKDEEPELV